MHRNACSRFLYMSSGQCNSLLYALPESQNAQLQRIQNSAARLVPLFRKFNHIIPILRELHRLPVNISYHIISYQSYHIKLYSNIIQQNKQA